MAEIIHPDALKDFSTQLFLEIRKFNETPSPGIGEEQPVAASVIRISTPLDETVCAQLVHQPHHGNGLNLKCLCQLVLNETVLVIELGERNILRPGHAVRAEPLLHQQAKQARRLDNAESRLTAWIFLLHGNIIYDVYDYRAQLILQRSNAHREWQASDRCVEPDGHRTVIHQLDLHIGTEDSGFHGNAEGRERLTEL